MVFSITNSSQQSGERQLNRLHLKLANAGCGPRILISATASLKYLDHSQLIRNQSCLFLHSLSSSHVGFDLQQMRTTMLRLLASDQTSRPTRPRLLKFDLNKVHPDGKRIPMLSIISITDLIEHSR